MSERRQLVTAHLHPDRGLDPQLFGLRDDAPPTEPLARAVSAPPESSLLGPLFSPPL